MKKVATIIEIVFTVAFVIYCVNILIDMNFPGYCKVEHCPTEAAMGSKYCYTHKCDNSSCKNKAVLYGYCEKCLERAQ